MYNPTAPIATLVQLIENDDVLDICSCICLLIDTYFFKYNDTSTLASSKMDNEVKPISREDVEKSKSDISNALQDALLRKLIEDTNQGINEAVLRNQTFYNVHVPSVVLGFPTYSTGEIAKRLQHAYTNSGFSTKLVNVNTVIISW